MLITIEGTWEHFQCDSRWFRFSIKIYYISNNVRYSNPVCRFTVSYDKSTFLHSVFVLDQCVDAGHIPCLTLKRHHYVLPSLLLWVLGDAVLRLRHSVLCLPLLSVGSHSQWDSTQRKAWRGKEGEATVAPISIQSAHAAKPPPLHWDHLLTSPCSWMLNMPLAI